MRSKILVVLVSSGGQIGQKVIDLDEQLLPSDLHQAANYLNTEFTGLTLQEVREAVEKRLRDERALYDVLFARALRLAHSTLEAPVSEPNIVVEGTSSLLEDPGTGSRIPLDTLRALLQMVEEKQRLVRILNEYIDGPGLTVVIGGEHRTPDLRPFSLVAARYFDERTSATVGVIGPTRMRYSRAIHLVGGTARAISRLVRDEN